MKPPPFMHPKSIVPSKGTYFRTHLHSVGDSKCLPILIWLWEKNQTFTIIRGFPSNVVNQVTSVLPYSLLGTTNTVQIVTKTSEDHIWLSTIIICFQFDLLWSLRKWRIVGNFALPYLHVTLWNRQLTQLMNFPLYFTTMTFFRKYRLSGFFGSTNI